MWLWSTAALAGMGPAHTMVLFNADSPDATLVAEHYRDARDLADAHLCGISGIDPLMQRIDFDTFDTVVRDTFEACLQTLVHPDEIDVVVTVRGLPYIVDLGGSSVGFEAALQVMRATLPGDQEIAGVANRSAAAVPNPTYVGTSSCAARDLLVANEFGAWYRGSCALTREQRLPRGFARANRHELDGWDFTGNLLVVGRLDGFDFDDAHALVDRGVASDGASPDGELLCMHGADSARGARDPECEYTVRRMQEVGSNAVWLPEFDGKLTGHRVVALFTGAASFRDGIDGQDWAPGAIACNLTSTGAAPTNFFCDETGEVCPASESQTSIARFVRAGATGAHGTVAEPLNNSFPDASTLLLYHEGYSLGESFLYSSEFLYWFNLVLGDPLATPFATRPTVQLALAPTADLPMEITADHPDGIDRIVLYVGGERVAEAEGPQLEWSPELPVGADVEFLAVATASSALIGRPQYDDGVTPPTGWNVPDPDLGQRVRPQTQGWLRGSTVVEAAPASTDELGQRSCGCSAAGPLSWGWLLVPSALVTLRRRRSAALALRRHRRPGRRSLHDARSHHAPASVGSACRR